MPQNYARPLSGPAKGKSRRGFSRDQLKMRLSQIEGSRRGVPPQSRGRVILAGRGPGGPLYAAIPFQIRGALPASLRGIVSLRLRIVPCPD